MLQTNHQRQVQLTKALKLLKGLQTQMVEFQRQHGPAKGPAQPDAPREAGIIYLVQHTKCYGYIPSSMALENGTKEKDHEVKPTPTLVTDTHTTTSITNAQIQAMINEGVTTALA
ncbi:hypothetical protein Tco_0334822, partial [Tanacetum coccineum]